MKYTKLGHTGLDVSRICVGCMSFGDSVTGNHTWTLDEDTSRGFIKEALDAGINFFDTANVYSLGTSEEIVGRALHDFADRDEVVLATKVHGPMRRGRNALGLSRKAIMTEVDASLRRLGMDYIDLYQIHRFDPRHTDRGDDGGAARRRQGRQGPLHRGVVDVRVAVQQGPVHRGAARLDQVRQHAEPLQPPEPRGGARDDAAVCRSGRRRHPVESARAREAHPGLGRGDGAVGDRRLR